MYETKYHFPIQARVKGLRRIYTFYICEIKYSTEFESHSLRTDHVKTENSDFYQDCYSINLILELSFNLYLTTVNRLQLHDLTHKNIF